MSRTTVRVEYHYEVEGWWADSVDIEGYTAVADTLHDLRQLVKEGVPFFLDVDPSEVDVEEVRTDGVLVYDFHLNISGQASSPDLIPEQGSSTDVDWTTTVIRAASPWLVAVA